MKIGWAVTLNPLWLATALHEEPTAPPSKPESALPAGPL